MHPSARLLAAIGLTITSVAIIRADDSAMNDGAYGPEPVGGLTGKESVIAMTSEQLHFSVGKQVTDVVAKFTFRSGKIGAAAKQIVGFPDVGAAIKEGDRRDPNQKASWHNQDNTAGALENLRTFIDGVEVKSELKYDFVKTDDDGTWHAATPQTGYLMAWHVVPVSFPPDRDVVIERRYHAPNGGAVYGILSFTYITHTGSNWRGPIGELVAEVELRDGLTVNDLAWDDGSLPKFQKDSGWFTEPGKSEWKIIDATHMRLVWHDFEPRDEKNRRSVVLMTKATQKPEE